MRCQSAEHCTLSSIQAERPPCEDCAGVRTYIQQILVNPSQFVLKNLGGVTSLVDYPNQYAAFSINSSTN